jgi:hypothetical protein
MQMNVIYMIIASFIIQYWAMPVIMTDSVKNITNSIGKLYISIIMALIMGLLEVFMPMGNSMMHKQHSNIPTIIALSVLLCIFLYVYRNQKGVDDANYLSEMIEHHSMAVLTSSKIIKKTRNPKVKKLARKIEETQKDEIEQMRKIKRQLKNL